MHAPLIKSQFTGQFRIGRVSSVDAKAHRVTVDFDEQDGMTIEAMPMLVTRPGDYSLPAEDSLVLCLLVVGRLGTGYVLGSFYSDSDAAPLSDAGQRSLAGDDLRLGDPHAEKAVGLDGDQSDGGTLMFVPGSGGAALAYFEPGITPTGPGSPIPLKAKLSASAEKVKAK